MRRLATIASIIVTVSAVPVAMLIDRGLEVPGMLVATVAALVGLALNPWPLGERD